MRESPYYSIRTGKNPDGGRLDLPLLKRFFMVIYKDLLQNGYFQESFGIDCTDGYQPGTLGEDIEAKILWKIRKERLYPIENYCADYSEDDLFDIIEFLYDHISKPIDGYIHSYSNCGYHYQTFDQEGGRFEYREKINELLAEYQEGYELSASGELQIMVEPGLDTLIKTVLPKFDSNNVDDKVQYAIAKFRRHRASNEEKLESVRVLADVLEFLRPELEKVLTKKDEADLFQIANNFGIRHHNPSQKTDYDQSIWCGWMFFFYLNTIHVALRLIKKRSTEK
ncbi:MAG: hypothetical protein ACYC6A_08555 [Armatimonadota bacterium]